MMSRLLAGDAFREALCNEIPDWIDLVLERHGLHYRADHWASDYSTGTSHFIERGRGLWPFRRVVAEIVAMPGYAGWRDEVNENMKITVFDSRYLPSIQMIAAWFQNTFGLRCDVGVYQK